MPDSTPLHILAISGSLRHQSANSLLLKALSLMAPPQVSFSFYEGLEDLPAFNPDKPQDVPAVLHFRQLLAQAHAVIISTPEYAFGVPGVLKNALDWVVSTGEFNEKPIAAISASPLTSGGDKALESLLHTLTALGTVKDERSSLSIPIVKKKINESGTITDEETKKELQALLEHLLSVAQQRMNT
jgi:NAD(P)H-dependent FMN reductase